jgi:hypothetical protein
MAANTDAPAMRYRTCRPRARHRVRECGDLRVHPRAREGQVRGRRAAPALPHLRAPGKAESITRPAKSSIRHDILDPRSSSHETPRDVASIINLSLAPLPVIHRFLHPPLFSYVKPLEVASNIIHKALGPGQRDPRCRVRHPQGRGTSSSTYCPNARHITHHIVYRCTPRNVLTSCVCMRLRVPAVYSYVCVMIHAPQVSSWSAGRQGEMLSTFLDAELVGSSINLPDCLRNVYQCSHTQRCCPCFSTAELVERAKSSDPDCLLIVY